MKDNKNIEPVQIFTGMAWEAQLLKNILENNGINAFITNEQIGTLAPFYITPGVGAVGLLVSSADAEKAREIAAAFQSEGTGEAADSDEAH